MSALATVSGAGFLVNSLRTSPAVAMMPPITEQPPATTTVVAAGSVLRPSWSSSEEPWRAACSRTGRNPISSANTSSTTVVTSTA